MFTMDFNYKGITWAGNIYQKFEAMCLEVEDIVCQETAKYVESQVQTVGVSVKKFYAEVMQDLLPPSLEPVKEADSDLSLEQNVDVETYKKSKVGNEEEPIKETPHPHKLLEVSAPAGKDSSRVSFSSGLRNRNHLLPPSSVDPVKRAGSGISLEQNNVMHNRSKEGIEENFTEEKPPAPGVSEAIALAGRDSSQESLFSCLHNKDQLLSPSSVDPAKGVGSDLSLKQNGDAWMYKTSRVGIDEDPLKEKPPPLAVSEGIAPAEKDLSQASLFSRLHNENRDNACNTLTKMPPPTSADVTGCNPHPRAGTIGTDVLDATGCIADILSALPSSDLILPVVPSENEVVETGPIPSSIILSTELNATDTSKTYETVSLMGSSRNGPEQYSEHAELEMFVPLPEIGRSDDDNAELAEGNDAVEPGIETIEGFDNAKLEESCIVVDSEELCFVSHRAGKHRSYKKKIRDAFASKMRSAKKQECEQLAIWYGDIGAGTNQQRVESSTSFSLARNLDPKKLPIPDFCESEWELL